MKNIWKNEKKKKEKWKMKRSHGYVWPWARTPRAYSRGWGGVQPLNAALVFFYHFWFLFLFFNFFILVDIKIYTHIFCEFLNENFNLEVEICFFKIQIFFYIFNSLNILKLLRLWRVEEKKWRKKNKNIDV